MNRRIVSILLVFLAIAGILAGCTAEAHEEVFTVPETGKQIEGTVRYDKTNFFEGIYFGMSYDDYIDLASGRYGKTANVSYDAKAAKADEGSEWEVVHTKLYDASREINSFVTAIFLNGKLDQMRAGSLVYATSVENFKLRAEELIVEHEYIYGDLKDNSLSPVAGGYQSFTKWQHRFWETYYGIETTGYLEEGFYVDIALPDELVSTEENNNTVYVVDPYEEGQAGVILYTYMTRRATHCAPDYSEYTDDMLWFTENHNTYSLFGNYYPEDYEFDFNIFN